MEILIKFNPNMSLDQHQQKISSQVYSYLTLYEYD